MTTFIETSEIRAEVKSNFVFVRNLNAKGGVISSTLNTRSYKKVVQALQNVKSETFSQVWDSVMFIKGTDFAYQAN